MSKHVESFESLSNKRCVPHGSVKPRIGITSELPHCEGATKNCETSLELLFQGRWEGVTEWIGTRGKSCRDFIWGQRGGEGVIINRYFCFCCHYCFLL
mmetsp:Transcript_64770/g.76696  ORF Transcript_64770/g.76696 Transcript_64770/m.76696 type:complete len:98 (+) Transcript_64770:369-662(+)